MKKHRFYKENGTWFIDLKWYPGNKANLAMVCGADNLLDILSNYSNEVWVQYTSKMPTSHSIRLERTEVLGPLSGAIYRVMGATIRYNAKGVNTLWLCGVTLLVFKGRYPKFIYIN